MKEELKSLAFTLIVGLIISIAWQTYELLAYGTTYPDIVDAIITILLAFGINAIRKQRKRLKLYVQVLDTYRRNEKLAENIIESQAETIIKQNEVIQTLSDSYKKLSN